MFAKFIWRNVQKIYISYIVQIIVMQFVRATKEKLLMTHVVKEQFKYDKNIVSILPSD